MFSLLFWGFIILSGLLIWLGPVGFLVFIGIVVLLFIASLFGGSSGPGPSNPLDDDSIQGNP